MVLCIPYGKIIDRLLSMLSIYVEVYKLKSTYLIKVQNYMKKLEHDIVHDIVTEYLIRV